MSLLPALSSALSFRWRNVAAVLLVAAGGLAQAPRFELPATPFDYGAPDVPHFRRVQRGCGGGTPAAAKTAGDLWHERQARRRAQRRDLRATLGRVLFYDDLLSRDRSRSCASCHRQELAFTDGRARSRGVGGARTRRSALTLVNAAYGCTPLFWDGRAQRLEEAVLQPIAHPGEMGLPLGELVARLEAEPGYAALFAAAFGDPTVSEPRIADALATFVGAIASFGSPYDLGLAAVKGDVKQDFPNFTAAENRGKAVFFGHDAQRRASCATCHVQRGVGCGGQTLNYFADVLQGNTLANNGVDSGVATDDAGLGAVTGEGEDRGVFRAPTLRNIAVTAPYMHDGRFRTLEQVVAFYATGVRPHANLDARLARTKSGYFPRGSEAVATTVSDAPTLVGPSPGMPLSVQQRRDLVAFLKTLTDEPLLTDPRFADPFVRR